MAFFSSSKPRYPSFPYPHFFFSHPFPHPSSLSTLGNGLSKRPFSPPPARSHACNVAEQMRHRNSTQREVSFQLSSPRPVEKSAGRHGSRVFDEKMEQSRGKRCNLEARISREDGSRVFDEKIEQTRAKRCDLEARNRREDGSSVFDKKMEQSRGKRHDLEVRNRGFRHMSASERSRNGKTRGKSKKMEFGPIVEKMREKMVRSKKTKFGKPETELRVRLETCSKTGDVLGAIALYDSAVRDGVRLQQYHYSVLLYLCSSAAIGVVHPAKSGSGNVSISSISSLNVSGEGDVAITRINGDESMTEVVNDHGSPLVVSDEERNYARKRGFEMYEKMCLEGVPMSEAALTSVARMAMSMGNGDMAFEIVKRMKNLGVTPRLRSYGPALFAYCNANDIEKAFEVEAHMLENRVYPEEPELQALLKASVEARRGDKVYYLLHKLRTSVRQVSPSTADVIEEWFESPTVSRVGKRTWDEKIVAQAIQNGGGGWHGLGWLGKGKWKVEHTNVDTDGVCMSCGEKLVTIDLDPIETENFAESVAFMACKRERNSSFQKFQKWLDYYGPFEAVVDAANVGLFTRKTFSTTKVNAVVNAIRQKLPSKKWPLIIIHNKRIFGGKMNEPNNAKLIEKWRNADAIYATPTGSNDDWYWLYAAIKCKSLIITNDEMRDHIFQILGNDFFPKWKERHQVRFSFHDGSFEFHMPPPCSVVIQESDKGHWHIPIAPEDDSGSKRTWLCVTRVILDAATKATSIPPKEPDSKKVKKVASKTRLKNQTRSLTDDNYRQKLQPFTECLQEMLTSTQKNTGTGKMRESSSIILDMEAAEKLSDCVIDFQI